MRLAELQEEEEHQAIAKCFDFLSNAKKVFLKILKQEL